MSAAKNWAKGAGRRLMMRVKRLIRKWPRQGKNKRSCMTNRKGAVLLEMAAGANAMDVTDG